jgi:hypothetical protein
MAIPYFPLRFSTKEIQARGTMRRTLPPDVEPFPGAETEEFAAGRAHRCAWKGCDKHGAFPAPKDRQLVERYMFCLDHVRAYNAQWDFHKGLSSAEIEAELRGPATWDRPTWKMGTLGGWGNRRAPWSGKFRTDDPFDLGADTAFDPKTRRHADPEGARPPGVKSAEAQALKLLGLSLPLTLEELRRRYKALVKKHHPDANGGSSEAETRMKRINAAYQMLRATLSAAP